MKKSAQEPKPASIKPRSGVGAAVPTARLSSPQQALSSITKQKQRTAHSKLTGQSESPDKSSKKAPKAAKILTLPPGVSVTKRILVIDIGGSNVKVMIAGQPRRKIPSKNTVTPKQLVAEVLASTADWKFDAISIGFPSPIEDGKIVREPNNLAPGWMKFDWEKAFGKPVKLINDAAMQALGSYEGGRMLFLGLGTGLGSALVHHGTLIALELCEARYSKGLTLEDVLGKRGYNRLGPAKWEKALLEIVEMLQKWFLVDYIVLGGGNVKKLSKLPAGTRPGDNRNAFVGGVRMWSEQIEAANRPRL